MIQNPNNPTSWHSSYEQNNYGDLFYSLVRVYQPERVVELGTKAGYSAYHIARALSENGHGTLDCYDLWEKYPFHSVPLSVAKENLKEFIESIRFFPGDAFGKEKQYSEVDILHIDLSNEGGILEQVVCPWINKVNQLIIIEGGSAQRDQVDWMIKYKKAPIKKWLTNFSRRFDVEYFTVEPFPSVTLLRKRL